MSITNSSFYLKLLNTGEGMKKIIIMVKDEEAAKLIESILVIFGYRDMEIEPDQIIGCKKIGEGGYGLVIFDVLKSEESLQFIQACSESCENPPNVIFITSGEKNLNLQSLIQLIERKAEKIKTMFFQKPFPLGEMAQAVEKLLQD